MFANATEIILIILIVVIVFGVGKLPNIAAQLGRMRSEFKKGLEGEGEDAPIDITPRGEEKKPAGRKPGKFDADVEDADVEST